MASVNNYTFDDYVFDLARIIKKAKKIRAPKNLSKSIVVQMEAPVVLLFSPHPDDECITGALPIRLMREKKNRIINIAVTLGSKKNRKKARAKELKDACNCLGFFNEIINKNGLDGVNLETRSKNSKLWYKHVNKIVIVLKKYSPKIILFPHKEDSNKTHIGVHHLIFDSLKKMPPNFSCVLVETEYWSQISEPNLMVELSACDLALLIKATSHHVGEITRNPYHITLPMWMVDNVRRGSELVGRGAQGARVEKFLFSTLYKVSKWKNGSLYKIKINSKVACNESFTWLSKL